MKLKEIQDRYVEISRKRQELEEEQRALRLVGPFSGCFYVQQRRPELQVVYLQGVARLFKYRDKC